MHMSIQKARNITHKTYQDVTLIRNINQEVNNQVLNRIFGQNLQQTCSPLVISQQKTVQNCINSKLSRHSSQQSQEEYRQDFQQEEDDDSDEQDYSVVCPADQIIAVNNQEIQLRNQNYQLMIQQLRLRDQAKMQIDRRAALQMGVITQQIAYDYTGIDTSLNSVHHFLLSFFKFYILYYREDFLRLVNMPYGYNITTRISALQGCLQKQGIEEDQQGVIYGLRSVIAEEILDQFYNKIYKQSILQNKENQEDKFYFQRIHHRALLDAFNQALNYFRPYFLINGQPYPWNNSEKALTFYFIAEENIQEVFQKSQFKVLKWASSLCGIMVDKYQNPHSIQKDLSVQQALQSYTKQCHPILSQTREDRLKKDQKLEITQSNYKWTIFQEQKTAILLQTSKHVFDLITEELLQWFYRTSQLTSDRDYQKQSINRDFQLIQILHDDSSLDQFQIY